MKQRSALKPYQIGWVKVNTSSGTVHPHSTLQSSLTWRRLSKLLFPTLHYLTMSKALLTWQDLLPELVRKILGMWPMVSLKTLITTTIKLFKTLVGTQHIMWWEDYVLNGMTNCIKHNENMPQFGECIKYHVIEFNLFLYPYNGINDTFGFFKSILI